MDLISLLIIFPKTLMSWSLSPFSLSAFFVSLNVTSVSFPLNRTQSLICHTHWLANSWLDESCRPNYHMQFQREYEPSFLKWSSEVQVLHCWHSTEALLRERLSLNYRTVFPSVSLVEARHSLLPDHRFFVESLFLSWSSLSIFYDKRHLLHEG